MDEEKRMEAAVIRKRNIELEEYRKEKRRNIPTWPKSMTYTKFKPDLLSWDKEHHLTSGSVKFGFLAEILKSQERVTTYEQIQTRLGKEHSDEETYSYYSKFGSYLKALNRGGLCIPNDSVVQWAVFSYLIFMAIEDACCINLLIKAFMEVAERHRFKIERKHCRRLGNTFLKNAVVLKSPLSKKESNLRTLKLSS